MNIIKLKDIIMSENNNISTLFNEKLKGRYAYWIHMRYIVPFDYMRHEGYVACEEDITKLLKKENGTYPKPYGCPYIDMYEENMCIMRYIDLEATDYANNISRFRIDNETATDNNITIDMLKNFRTWLAQTLLDMNNIKDSLDGDIRFGEDIKHILYYYANNMYNDVIKYLSMFSNSREISDVKKKCDCCMSSDLISLTTISDCNSIDLYRNSIKNKMIELFSSISFWRQWNDDFLKLFKLYIDNIIRINLKINIPSNNISVYYDCGCNENGQDTNMEILRRLSQSLQYIINNEYITHKNYISDSLFDWSSKLYEYMQW